LKILDASYTTNYDTGTPTLHIWGVGGEHQTIYNYRPYFYVGFNDHIKEDVALQLLKSHGFKHVTPVKKFRPIGYQETPYPMYQIFTVSPREIREARDRASRIPNVFKIYEADIKYVNRVLIDHGLGGFSDIGDTDDVTMKYMGFDIECLPPTSGKMPDPLVDPVILISMSFYPSYNESERIVLTSKKTSYEGCTIIKCKDEADIIKTFLMILRYYDPDIIAGYNSNAFDIPYINTRCNKLNIRPQVTRDNRDWYIRTRFDGGVDVTITGRVVVDLLPIIRKSYSLSQYTLREAAKLVNYEKLDTTPKEMRETYLNGEGDNDNSNGTSWDGVIAYSSRDAELVMKLMLDLKLIDKYVALSSISGALLQDTINSGQTTLIDAKLMRQFRKENRVMNMRPHSDDEEEDEIRYEGATVLDPPTEMQENLAILDFQALYPSLIMAYNISYDTLILQNDVDIECNISPTGVKFVKPDIMFGIVPTILRELLDARLETKKQMKLASGQEYDNLDAKQNAMKILLNSFYGYAGYVRSRLFTIEIAESVTAWGRINIENTVKIIKENGYEVAYGDTDSVFIKINLYKDIDINDKLIEIEKIGNHISDLATSQLPSPMKLVFEAIAIKALFLTKKRYAMWRFEKGTNGWNGKLKTKGIATVRRDWCPLTSTTLKNVLNCILIEGDIKKAALRAHEAIMKIKLMDLKNSQSHIDELLLTRRYGGDLQKYKSEPVHINLIKRKIARGEPEPSSGDRIPFIIVNELEGTFTKKGEDPEYAISKGYTIDTEYYITKQLLPPLKSIFEPFHITEPMLRRGICEGGEVPSKQKTLFDI